MKLENLIKKHCPDGVEWKTLGEIATNIYRGSELNKEQVSNNGVYGIRYGDIYTKYDVWFDKCKTKINLDLIKNRKYVNYGDIVIECISQMPEDVGKCCAYLSKEKTLIGVNITAFSHNQNPKYLSYALSTYNSKKQKIKFSKIGALTSLNIESIKKIKIPVPPLEIQEKIAETLDKFRKIKELLERELERRKFQYEYYREQLLGNVGYNIMTIEDIATEFVRGNGITKEQLGTGDFPGVRYADLYKHFNIWFEKTLTKINLNLIKNPKYANYGDLIVTSSSEILKNIGKCCAYLGKEKIAIGQDTIKISHNQNPKYLAYALSTKNSKKQKEKFSIKGPTITHLYTKEIKKIKIPVPPLEIQEKIAETLDKLRNLCESVEHRIPKEILMRQQQYEYYKEKLISNL